MVRPVVLLLCAGTLACGSRDQESETEAPGAGVEVHAGWYYSFDEPIRLLEDGGSLPLRMAPQGGHWAFVSARVRGLTPTEMAVGVRLLDAVSGELLFAERRGGGVVQSPNDPHAVEPELDLRGAIVHIPVCPMEVLPGLYERRLRMQVEVNGSASGEVELEVTPDCSAGPAGERAVCECECAPDYDPGKCY